MHIKHSIKTREGFIQGIKILGFGTKPISNIEEDAQEEKEEKPYMHRNHKKKKKKKPL